MQLRIKGGANLLVSASDINKIKGLYEMCHAWIKVEGNDLLLRRRLQLSETRPQNDKEWAETNLKKLEELFDLKIEIEEE